MKLSPHFSLSEFESSATATAKGIDNTLKHSDVDHSRIIDNLRALCLEVLEPLRRHLDRPVVISSGYRCKKLNQLVGGVRTSQHMTGEAADIAAPKFDSSGKKLLPSESLSLLKEWMDWIADNTHFDQCIMEHRKNKDGTVTHWIHVSHSLKHNRRCVISNIWKK